MTSCSPSSYRPASLAPGSSAASCRKNRLMAWAPLVGTMDTPSPVRSRPDRRAASVKASSSVTPSTKTIVRTAEYCPCADQAWLKGEQKVDVHVEAGQVAASADIESFLEEIDAVHEDPTEG